MKKLKTSIKPNLFSTVLAHFQAVKFIQSTYILA